MRARRRLDGVPATATPSTRRLDVVARAVRGCTRLARASGPRNASRRLKLEKETTHDLLPTQVEAKKQEMQARRAQAVAEEFETMRAIAKKEREVAKKLEAVRLETEARIAREAAVRDAERKRKVEEKLKKSQAILKEIERKGEESRLKAIEKEKRIQAILEVRSRVASRRLHAVDATRVHQTMPGVLSFSSLRPFGPRRGRAACPREERSRRWREVARTDAVAAMASM